MENYVFIGNLGNNAELRQTENGSILLFNVAVNRNVKNPTPQDGRGEWIEQAKWISCILGGQRGEKLVQYLCKGTKVAVRGIPDVHTYITKDNQVGASLQVRVLELELLDGGIRERVIEQPQQQAQESSPVPSIEQLQKYKDIEDVPF